MSFLKSLTLTTVPKINNDPIRSRRERLVSRLQEQKELVANPSLIRTVQRTVKKDGRDRRRDPTEAAGSPWWRTDEKGQVIFFVRVGWKPIEFEKGKAGIVAELMERLPEVIDVLIGAVRAGELDPMLATAGDGRVRPSRDRQKARREAA